ncbi:sigma-70 family RNA polymerase sigma factor [Candidatus Methylospira mobilis]|uniref:RNA polymerase sigma factor n=1 Tax=Candidatus Methylospira mobilis TaxID=1808979 RepID=A0A5Q0BIV4_9GAMM|nr:sigma-70 family RNA polymerase sigma factor [Candidatus Methylospira mobilis]QFY41756.1 sigma-70 family RNA polymerase sigma factor [Candidatus Methylospira mobilis]WNV06614.1 sigma-70 family RNA polymerase sigma factor [Candidatus Methylospira mobilis]
MTEQNKTQRFNKLALQHLDAAYNLARWLTRNSPDAEDVVQESLLKAFRHFDGFRGGNGKAWFLTIVRNSSYTWLKSQKGFQQESFDEGCDYDDFNPQFPGAVSWASDPEQLVLQEANRELIDAAIRALPAEFREVLVLRELEDFSYKEIAAITGRPVGTVMSRLARSRALLRRMLAQHFSVESAR